MRSTIQTPADLQTAPVPFTSKDLKARGYTEFALQDESRFTQIFRGVWIETYPTTMILCPPWADKHWLRQQTKVSALRLLHPSVIADSVTAALLYRLPLPNRVIDCSTHVLGEDRNLRIRRPGVKLRRSAGFGRTDFYGLPLISATDLFFELASPLSKNELIAVGDTAISRRNSGPLTSLALLRAHAEASDYLRARKRAERALALVRETVDSPRETWLRLWIIDNGFPEPVVHPTADCSWVSRTLHPDLGYPEIKLAIEYEGDHHRTSSIQFGVDIERRQLLEAEGWVVLRVSKRIDMANFKQILTSYLG